MTETILEHLPTANGNPLSVGSMLHQRPTYGIVQLEGDDRQDFLHRLTTNEINKLTAGESTVTIVTSPTARVLFAFTVVARQNDLLLLPGEGQTRALIQHLRSQIFFMDSVTVADQSESWSRMRLMGHEAADALATVNIDVFNVADGAWVEQAGIIAVKQDRFDVPGYELLCPTDESADVVARLEASGVTLIDDVAYDHLRILLGRPAAGVELTDAANPLESGMAWACADDKGCYTGQEIIARQITYDKVTRTLVGIRGEHPIDPGMDIHVDGRNVGTTTSVTQDPTSGDYLALAIVKRPANQPGVSATVDGHSAVVTSLPFVQN